MKTMSNKSYKALSKYLHDSINEYCAMGLDSLLGWKFSFHAVFRLIQREDKANLEVSDEQLKAMASKAIGCLIHSIGFNVRKDGMETMKVSHPISHWVFVLDYDSKTVVTAYPSKWLTKSQQNRRQKAIKCAA